LLNVRYKRFFNNDINVNDTASLKKVITDIAKFSREFFNDYLAQKATHYASIPYRKIKSYGYIGKGNVFKPLSVVLSDLADLEQEWSNKNVAPLDEDEERSVLAENGIKVTDFIVINNDFKWVLKNNYKDSIYESPYGHHCGNAEFGTHSNSTRNLLSLRERAKYDPDMQFRNKNGEIIKDGWHIQATCAYDTATGYVCGAKGVSFAKSGDESSSSVNVRNLNGNLKPSKRIKPYYIELMKRPEIRGFSDKDVYKPGPEYNFSLSDLSKSEMEQLKKDILAVFDVSGVDKLKYINFFGVEDAIKDGIVENEEEARQVQSTEINNSVRDVKGNIKKSHSGVKKLGVAPVNTPAEEEVKVDTSNESFNTIEKMLNRIRL
jgi:hypothetical protein